ncbi:hypothetical protein M8J76_008361 [Diaphorina citri]|nr:hypothetical protein M8J76_008361 [Diaphorina citri]
MHEVAPNPRVEKPGTRRDKGRGNMVRRDDEGGSITGRFEEGSSSPHCALSDKGYPSIQLKGLEEEKEEEVKEKKKKKKKKEEEEK